MQPLWHGRIWISTHPLVESFFLKLNLNNEWMSKSTETEQEFLLSGIPLFSYRTV